MSQNSPNGLNISLVMKKHDHVSVHDHRHSFRGGALAPQTVDHRHYFFKTELAYGTYYIL